MHKFFFLILAAFISHSTFAGMVDFTLRADIRGFIGVGGRIDGVRNPDLVANKGDMVMITIINDNPMPHDFKMDAHHVQSPVLQKKGDEAMIHFTAETDEFYYCSLPGHANAGMKGRFVIKKQEEEDSETPLAEVVKRADDIPKPITYAEPKEVTFNITAREVEAKLEDFSTYKYWTYDGTVPGPLLRVREGDTVIVNLKNLDQNMVHSIDFHAVQMQHGGAHVLQVPPQETRSLKFVAKKAGLYVYHCATPHVPTHLAKGMYGMILVEPKEGLTQVDKEFYVMQGEYYTKESVGFRGRHEHDSTRLSDERPTFVVMNGRPQGLSGDFAMQTKSGETVRIFFGVGGPNLVSSFHLMGEIFDKVYPYGSFSSFPFYDVQTVLVPAGGATVVEVMIDEPGHYVLVDHSLSRMDKGATAEIHAH